MLGKKLTTLCASFGSSNSELPRSRQKLLKNVEILEQEISENIEILKATQSQIDSMCSKISEVHQDMKISKCELWRLCILRDKAIWEALNTFSPVSDSNLIYCEFWCPEGYISKKDQCLAELKQNDNYARIEIEYLLPKGTPPSYFSENEFLFGFQEIVNTYGIPRYKEFNPAVFASGNQFFPNNNSHIPVSVRSHVWRYRPWAMYTVLWNLLVQMET
jgi:V-type H+-transporting ATPase subunit a